MSKVASETPDRPSDRPIDITRIADTQKSDAHVAQLLHIAEHCGKYLYARAEVGESLDVNPVLTKEAAKTYELTHTRLRDLIDEQRRWSLDPTANERESSKLIDSTMDLYGAKTENAKIHNRPCVFLRAKLGKFSAGWFAWIGGEVPTSRDVHGRGDSPALAMAAFDAAYYDLRDAAEIQQPQAAPKRAPRKPRKND